MKKHGEQNRISLIHSIIIKVVLLTTVIIMAMSVTSIYCASTRARSAVEDIYNNYMQSISEQAAKSVGTFAFESNYRTVLAGAGLKGIESSYAYLVDKDGTMLYHPVDEKIGKPVENAVIKEVVQELSQGNRLDTAVVTYDYNGVTKYACYAITVNNRIVVLAADQDEVIASVDRMIRQMIRLSVIAGVVCWISGLALSILICLPIWKMSRVIRVTSELDLRSESDDLRLVKRKDELGMLSSEIQMVRQTLRDLLLQINDTGRQINESVDSLYSTTEQINSICMNNSSAAEELTSGMSGAVASISNINCDMQTAKGEANQIASMAEAGFESSNVIMERAVNLTTQADRASAETMEMYTIVKQRADAAMESSRSVKNIDKLIEAIQQISSQITLLSLNASIEAARAGEAGKGFGVVAHEIKDLAGKTAKTIADINSIVGNVKVAVDNMSSCISDVTQFLERKVLSDYQEFGSVSKQYQEDADSFKTSMTQIHKSISLLTETMESTAISVDSIRSTVDNSAAASADIADKTSVLANQVSTNFKMVTVCSDCVLKLKDAVNQFTLE